MAVGTLISSVLDKRRLRAYLDYCRQRGFHLRDQRLGEEKRHLDTCPVFAEEGDWGYTMSGSLNGVPFMAFEYKWWVQSFLVRGGRTKTISAMIWTLEEEVPQFILTPEGMYKWLVVPLWPRIQLEPPGGLEGYWLQGTDDARIRTFFGPSVRAYLAANRHEHVAGGGRELMWWRRGHLPSPDKLDGFLAMGQRIRGLFAVRHVNGRGDR